MDKITGNTKYRVVICFILTLVFTFCIIPVRDIQAAVINNTPNPNAGVYEVTNTKDDGSSGSLRWAVGQANANRGSTVQFNLPTSEGEIPVIWLETALEVTADMTIDASSSPHSIELELMDDGFPHISANYNSLTLKGLDFYGGGAEGAGGINGASVLNVENCTFYNIFGNVLVANAGDVSMKNSEVYGCIGVAENKAPGVISGQNVSITNSTIMGNVGTDKTIIMAQKALTMSGSTVSENMAGSNGGAIYCQDATISDSTISGNKAAMSGGGAYVASSATLTNCIFEGNAAKDLGGGIYARNLVINGGSFTANGATNGGGVYAKASLTINDCTVSTNLAMESGAGAYAGSSATLARSEFSNNVSQLNGGGIYCGSDSNSVTGTVKAENCTFALNKASQYGGGICANTTELIYATITGNVSGYRSSAINRIATGGVLDASYQTDGEDGIKITFDDALGDTNQGEVQYSGEGGGVYTNDADVILSILCGNYAAVDALGSSTYIPSNLFAQGQRYEQAGGVDKSAYVDQGFHMTYKTDDVRIVSSYINREVSEFMEWTTISDPTNMEGVLFGKSVAPAQLEVGMLKNNGGKTNTVALKPYFDNATGFILPVTEAAASYIGVDLPTTDQNGIARTDAWYTPGAQSYMHPLKITLEGDPDEMIFYEMSLRHAIDYADSPFFGMHVANPENYGNQIAYSMQKYMLGQGKEVGDIYESSSGKKEWTKYNMENNPGYVPFIDLSTGYQIVEDITEDPWYIKYKDELNVLMTVITISMTLVSLGSLAVSIGAAIQVVRVAMIEAGKKAIKKILMKEATRAITDRMGLKLGDSVVEKAANHIVSKQLVQYTTKQFLKSGAKQNLEHLNGTVLQQFLMVASRSGFIKTGKLGITSQISLAIGVGTGALSAASAVFQATMLPRAEPSRPTLQDVLFNQKQALERVEKANIESHLSFDAHAEAEYTQQVETNTILRQFDPIEQSVLKEEIAFATPLRIRGQVKDDGSPHTLIANKVSGRIFNASTTETIELENLIFYGATAGSQDGGAIYAPNATVIARNCVFSNNSAARGAAIFAKDVVLIDCVFEDNASTGDGGAVYATGTVTGENVRCERNSAGNGKGGAICAGGDITITGAKMISNKATGDGGAIYSTGNVHVNIGEMSENTAQSGSAISAKNIDLKSATVAENTGSALMATGTAQLVSCTVSANDGVGVQAGGVALSASIVAGNYVNTDVSGAVTRKEYSFYDIPEEDLPLLMDTNVKRGKTVGWLKDNGGYGRTIAINPLGPAFNAMDEGSARSFGVPTIDQRGLLKTSGGDGYDIGAMEVYVIHPVNNTQTIAGTIYEGLEISKASPYSGNAIEMTSKSVGSSSEILREAIVIPESITILNNVSSGGENRRALSGGDFDQIFIADDSDVILRLYGLDLLNSAGNAIGITGRFEAAECSFNGNTSDSDKHLRGSEPIVSEHGGAIMASSVFLSNCSFDGNTSKGNGGAVAIMANAGRHPASLIRNSTFVNNTAGSGNGAAIYTAISSTQLNSITTTRNTGNSTIMGTTELTNSIVLGNKDSGGKEATLPSVSSNMQNDNILGGTSQNYTVKNVFRTVASQNGMAVVETNGNRVIAPLQLSENNPAVMQAADAGASAITQIPLIDQIGQDRYSDGIVCRGAVEQHRSSIMLKSLTAGGQEKLINEEEIKSNILYEWELRYFNHQFYFNQNEAAIDITATPMEESASMQYIWTLADGTRLGTGKTLKNYKLSEGKNYVYLTMREGFSEKRYELDLKRHPTMFVQVSDVAYDVAGEPKKSKEATISYHVSDPNNHRQQDKWDYNYKLSYAFEEGSENAFDIDESATITDTTERTSLQDVNAKSNTSLKIRLKDGVAYGKVTVTATTNQGAQVASQTISLGVPFYIEVTPEHAVLEHSQHYDEIFHANFKTDRNDASVLNDPNFDKSVIWTIEDENGNETKDVYLAKYSYIDIGTGTWAGVTKETPPGIYTIRATSVRFPDVSGTATIEVLKVGVRKVEVIPGEVTMEQGGSKNFQVNVDATKGYSKAVTWTLEDTDGNAIDASIASLDQNGKLTVGRSTPAGTVLIVKATSTADPTIFGTAKATVSDVATEVGVAPAADQIAPATAGDTSYGLIPCYFQKFEGTGGVGPYTYGIDGTLPEGLVFVEAGFDLAKLDVPLQNGGYGFDANTAQRLRDHITQNHLYVAGENVAVLVGSPAKAGKFPIKVTATDSESSSGYTEYDLMVALGLDINPSIQTPIIKGLGFPPDSLILFAAGATTRNTVTYSVADPDALLAQLGATFNPADCSLSSLPGTPTTTGVFTFTVNVQDPANPDAKRSYEFTITVVNP